jgi:hypothetical protein
MYKTCKECDNIQIYQNMNDKDNIINLCIADIDEDALGIKTLSEVSDFDSSNCNFFIEKISPYKSGMDAAYDILSYSTNPYKERTDDWIEWDEGFCHGVKDRWLDMKNDS